MNTRGTHHSAPLNLREDHHGHYLCPRHESHVGEEECNDLWERESNSTLEHIHVVNVVVGTDELENVYSWYHVLCCTELTDL